MVEKRKYDEYGRPIKKKSFFNKFSLNSKEDSQDQFDQYKPTKFKQIEKKIRKNNINMKKILTQIPLMIVLKKINF